MVVTLSGDELPEIESSVEFPPLACPKCDGLLPEGLGEQVCPNCHSRVRVDDPGLRRQWREECVACPTCSQRVVGGCEHRHVLWEWGSWVL